MDIAERTTIRQDIFKKQNSPYLDDSFHWLYVVCRCVSDTIPVQCHSGVNASGRTSVLFDFYSGTRDLHKLSFP